MAAPIIGLNVLNVLMLAVDSALCGRMPNSEPVLEALGFAIQIIFLLMVAMLGLIVGTVALVARAYGGGDTQRLNHLLVQSTQLTVIVGIVVGIVGALGAEYILAALGASDAAVELGAAYLRPMMIGTPFFYLTLLYAGILRGVGNTRIPFIVALGANAVNAVLNYGLILGNLGMPALGVTGSAIGTVIAQLLSVIALVIVLRRGSVPNLKLPLQLRKIDKPLAVELFRIGWPAALDMLVLNAGFLTALGMLGRIDDVTVAAHGLGLRVQALAFVPGLGVGQATAAMIGQALGAGNVQRAREVARASMLLCLWIMVVLALAIFLAAVPLVHVLVPDLTPALEAYSVEWMHILGYAMPPAAINIALIGVLQGSGATRTSLRINIWSTIAIQVPVALLLGFGFGLDETGVWWSFPIAFVAKAALNYVELKRERWAVTGVRMTRHV
ncbi:MAG TPA: MATE family efflux transporter [Kofleriaceae bacterium]